MLKREMDAFKRNNDRDTRRLEDLHKAQPRTAELERAKTLERYSGKKKKRCSLCEQTYALVNLPLTISYKAVLDLRSRYVTWVSRLALLCSHQRALFVLQLGRGCGEAGTEPQHGAVPALLQRGARVHILRAVLRQGILVQGELLRQPPPPAHPVGSTAHCTTCTPCVYAYVACFSNSRIQSHLNPVQARIPELHRPRPACT